VRQAGKKMCGVQAAHEANHVSQLTWGSQDSNVEKGYELCLWDADTATLP
jgi:hypothetical protein